MTGLRSIDGTFAASEFDRILELVVELLREHGRVSYRGLKRRFALDDDYIEDVKVELIHGRRVARDEDGQVLVWTQPAAVKPAADGGEARVHENNDAAERRQLTIMFCDLVSSTELSTRIDAEDYREMMLRYHAVCAAAVARYGGHVAQYLGDGLQVYFGYPVAQDDAAARAIHAALAIVQQLTAAESISLPVRIGIHSGVVVVGEIGFTGPGRDWLALGETPNLAARVQALAEPDSVVITAATRALLRQRFVLEDLGEHTLRGVARPIALYRPLAAEQTVSSAPPQRVFGRAADLALLRARFEAARAGTGQLVTISGEPGIGKTCLIRAFSAQLEAGVQQWECRCSAFHTGTALHPLAELLRQRFGIDANDPLEVSLRKLRAQLEACAEERHLGDVGQLEQTFAALLSLDGTTAPQDAAAAQRQRTIELLTNCLLARADREPVVLIIEDLHWADPSTLELLHTLIVQARATHAMILVSHRHGFDVASCEPEQRTTMTLERLATNDASELLRSATAGKRLPEEVARELLDRADGMPLFLEEMVRMLLDSELLTDHGTYYELTRPLSSVPIPSTISDSLMARLDQLGRAREVAQIGAVLGRSFSYEMIFAIWQRGERALCDDLALGVRSGLLLQRGFPPHATYTFKHALVQETAYGTLLRREKRAIHARAASAMLALLPQLAAAQPELVAHHFSEAHEFDAASRYYRRAAEQATKAAAHVEAVGHLCKALDQLLALPHSAERDRREGELLMQLLPPLIATRGYASTELAAACERAHALVAHSGSARERWPVLWGLWYHAEVGGAFARADVLAADLERLASECASDEYELQLCIVRGHAFWRGGLREARAHFERALVLYEAPGRESESVRFGQDPCVVALSYLGCIAVLCGESARGAELSERAIAHARKLRHPYSLALALGYAGSTAQLRSDRAAVRRYVSEQLTLCRDHGFDLWLAHGETLLAWADAGDDPTCGLSALQRCFARWRGIGARLWESHQLVLVAEVHLQLGQVDEGIELIDEADGLFLADGECLLAAELLRLRCELALRKELPDLVAVRSGLRRALAIAVEQGALLIEQRTQRSLRRLAQLEAASARVETREIN